MTNVSSGDRGLSICYCYVSVYTSRKSIPDQNKAKSLSSHFPDNKDNNTTQHILITIRQWDRVKRSRLGLNHKLRFRYAGWISISVYTIIYIWEHRTLWNFTILLHNLCFVLFWGEFQYNLDHFILSMVTNNSTCKRVKMLLDFVISIFFWINFCSVWD